MIRVVLGRTAFEKVSTAGSGRQVPDGRFRDEFLNQQVFLSVLDAQVRIACWRREYNEERPHSSLRYRTPFEFKREWRENPQEGYTAQLVFAFQASGD